MSLIVKLYCQFFGIFFFVCYVTILRNVIENKEKDFLFQISLTFKNVIYMIYVQIKFIEYGIK